VATTGNTLPNICRLHWSFSPAPSSENSLAAPLLLLRLRLLLVHQRARLGVRAFGAEYHGWRKIFGRRSIHWRNGNPDAQFAFGLAFMHSARRRNVGIVAADRHVHVAFAAEKIIGGIESHPARFTQKRFHPGMRGAGRRTIFNAVLVIQVAAHI